MCTKFVRLITSKQFLLVVSQRMTGTKSKGNFFAKFFYFYYNSNGNRKSVRTRVRGWQRRVACSECLFFFFFTPRKTLLSDSGTSNGGTPKINQFPIKVERRRYTKAPTSGSPSTRVSAVTMNRSRSIRLDFIGPKPGRTHDVIAVRTRSRPSGTPTERHYGINDRAEKRRRAYIVRKCP